METVAMGIVDTETADTETVAMGIITMETVDTGDMEEDMEVRLSITVELNEHMILISHFFILDRCSAFSFIRWWWLWRTRRLLPGSAGRRKLWQ